MIQITWNSVAFDPPLFIHSCKIVYLLIYLIVYLLTSHLLSRWDFIICEKGMCPIASQAEIEPSYWWTSDHVIGFCFAIGWHCLTTYVIELVDGWALCRLTKCNFSHTHFCTYNVYHKATLAIRFKTMLCSLHEIYIFADETNFYAANSKFQLIFYAPIQAFYWPKFFNDCFK